MRTHEKQRERLKQILCKLECDYNLSNFERIELLNALYDLEELELQARKAVINTGREWERTKQLADLAVKLLTTQTAADERIVNHEPFQNDVEFYLEKADYLLDEAASFSKAYFEEQDSKLKAAVTADFQNP